MPGKKEIIKLIDEAGLVGRGGAFYPVAKKWQQVKDALKKHPKGYIVINAAEGEPGVKKDGWLLEHEPELVVAGISEAYQFLGDKIDKIYFFLKADYLKAYQKKIEAILLLRKYQALKKKLVFFAKPEVPSYISGEETAILNIIEGKRAEPRLKPPYPVEVGLFSYPTLINNVETFYDIALVANNKYQGKRLYTLGGAVKKRGVFSLPINFSTEQILRLTGNYPNFPFFVMTGGAVCGELLRADQLAAPVEGSGLVMVYDAKKTDQKKLLLYWLNFYRQESCGACTACREGSYRLSEMFSYGKYDHDLFNDLLENLEINSLCALGSSLPLTIKSYFENIKQ